MRDDILGWLRRRARDYDVARGFALNKAALNDADLENWYQVEFAANAVYLLPESPPSWDMFQCLDRHLWPHTSLEPIAIWFRGRFDSLDLGHALTTQPPVRS